MSHDSDRTALQNRRRSPRISRVVSLAIQHGNRTFPAESRVINAHGALLVCPEPLFEGATIVITNRKLGTTVTAWVVGSTPGDTAGSFSLATDFLVPAPQFWGPEYTP
jgi:hypothetical protein